MKLFRFTFLQFFLVEYLKPYGAKDRKVHEKKAEEQAELKRLREAANEGTVSLNRENHPSLQQYYLFISLGLKKYLWFRFHIVKKLGSVGRK